MPPGGQLRTAAHAGADGSMTLDEFLADLYPNSSTERASLEARGFVSAATRWFIAANRQEVSIYLVSFGSPSGAQSYALALAKARGADPSFASATRFAVPALTDGAGFETLTLDSYGNTESFVYGAVKDVTVIVHCFTPAKPDRSQLLSFVGRQAARLAALH